MPTHLDQRHAYDDHIRYAPNERRTEPRRYAWRVLLYLTFAAFIALLFLLVR